MMVHKFAAGRLRKPKPRNLPVSVIKVRGMVWREALRLAGDPALIEIVDSETVIIRNRRQR